MERRKSVAHKPGTYASGFLARLGLAGFLALSLAGCLGYEGDVVHGYQIDPKLLDQVKVGSSAEQALIVMGTPSTTSTVGGDAWYYITQKTDRPVLFMDARITDQRVLAIYFDKDKKSRTHCQLRPAGRKAIRFRLSHDTDRGSRVRAS